MIDGRTRLVGVIGHPVEHSRSPAMHNAAFEALGMNWRYLPFPVAPGTVETAVRGLAAAGLAGLNVTIPHKQAVIPLLNTCSANVRRSNSANTLVFTRAEGGETTIHGESTDPPGFLAALRGGGFNPDAQSRVIIAGAGGSARAVSLALAEAGVTRVTILARDLARAASLKEELAGGFKSVSWQAGRLERAALLDAAVQADLLVNATPLGMWPQVNGTPWPEDEPFPNCLAVFDLVYNPRDTRLLQQARASGALAIGGLEMLVQQGALSFQMWTGTFPPLDVMRKAIS